jgi:diketogulonate reductase-like aldo/keto reductase
VDNRPSRCILTDIFSAFNGATSKWFPLREDGTFDLVDIDPATTYKAMEKLLLTGKVRAIGALTDLLSKTSIVPAVNQIEAHPYLQQPELLDFCKSRNILVEAYSPLGNNQTGEPRTVDDEIVGVISRRLNMDRGQVLASWGIQRGTVVLPKSVTLSRIKSNLQVKELPTDAFQELNTLERHKRFNQQSRWGYDIFEELGEDKVSKVARDFAQENKEKFTI